MFIDTPRSPRWWRVSPWRRPWTLQVAARFLSSWTISSLVEGPSQSKAHTKTKLSHPVSRFPTQFQDPWHRRDHAGERLQEVCWKQWRERRWMTCNSIFTTYVIMLKICHRWPGWSWPWSCSQGWRWPGQPGRWGPLFASTSHSPLLVNPSSMTFWKQ